MSRSLVHLFLDSAGRHPDRDAIITGDRRTSYRELVHRAGAVAEFLSREGLKRGDRVGVLLRNSPEYVAIYYGILAAGGAVVALNTATKIRDLSNWLRHCEPAWVFAESSHPQYRQLLQELGGVLRVVEVEMQDAPAQDPGAAIGFASLVSGHGGTLEPCAAMEPDALASIIYTSGTTGNPKGVMLSHANLFENTRSIVQYLGLGPDDRVMNVLPFYYSYGNSVLHTHLAAGGSVVLENSLLYPHLVLERMVAESVTGFSGVPATYSLLLNRTRLDEYDLSSLRYLTQAGGAMAPANIRRIRQLVPHARFFVMYGQTEASARLSYLPPEKMDVKSGSIGMAIPGVELGVFDPEGRPVATGTTGEICARGANIMLGYWKDAGMTAAVLRDGWLRTGDLAYQDDEGYIYIVGRSSEMIKTGAHRVNPAEIEEVILELDGVEEAVAIGVEDELLGQVIKVLIVPAASGAPDLRTIQAHCRNNMANFKIPKFIEFVSEIPKTASGKIQRHLLKTNQRSKENASTGS